MNQILYVNTNNKKGGPLEIKMVLRIFAIACIVFGILIVGKGVFAIINEKEVVKSVPTVEIFQDGDSLNLIITHDRLIDKVIYTWNDEKTETILQGKGRNQMTESIKLNKGINTLNLKVIDIDGQSVVFTKEYELEEGDLTNPEIELLQDGSKVKIVVRDEVALDYIKYYWNNEDATTLEARENSPKQIEERVTVLKGENTLRIVAVDKAGNESTKEQTYKGATKPTINLTVEGKILKIVVSDEEEIQKIDYILNDLYYSTDASATGESLKTKFVEIPQELADGKNKITVKAYNINGLEAEMSAEPTI